ncbi:hypothetical protein CLIB1423_23S01046 [[Candida] railenensis]|uniref:FAD/NAD(P)-binding domain-containing protein n=1 Tax=[Candida] railenensis TaxID=45579 RepID=A0A9P0W141_9ASCO|nr:hypothetical protein CLIB1423_23S01046 [[Candida] railenensis]
MRFLSRRYLAYMTTQTFKTDVLIAGGSYAGLSAVRALAVKWEEKRSQGLTKDVLNITLVEPRSGLLNILGIPRAIVDPEFAKTQYVGLENLNFKINQVISNDKEVVERINPEEAEADAAVNVTYIQGKVSDLSEKEAQYSLNNEDTKVPIQFKYALVCTGRDRNWPVTPDAFTPESYLAEMDSFRKSIEDVDIISIIGGGAVGVEMAGDIKHKYPTKTVQLIHPHPLYPPEPLTDEFKKLVHKSLVDDGEVKAILNTRIAEELPNGDLKTTTGEIIKSDKNYWCHNHKNNTGIFSESLSKEFVNQKNNVLVNEYLQLTNATNFVGHIFVLGDLVELPIIKSAGWGLYMGRQSANNVVNLITAGEVVEPIPNLETMPKGMVVVAGRGEIVSELTKIVELNNAHYVQEYKDYCLGKVRATLDL